MIALLLALVAHAGDEIEVPMDLQGHPAMHLTWKFYAAGLTDKKPRLTHKHQFRQTVYKPYLDRSGVRIFLMAAMAAEKARTPEQARRLILDQLAYVEGFAAANSDGYALARTPEQARKILRETDKMVIIHSIEGGHLLFGKSEDAAYWASKGVALVTVMHLRDDELGGAGILPLKIGPLINRAGAANRRKELDRGLTERGTQVVRELAEAGILVDLSHMTREGVDDALAVTGEVGAPPIVTHGTLLRLQETERSFSDEQVLEVYRQGGMFALSLAGNRLDPVGVEPPDDFCPGTLESWAHHYRAVVELVGEDEPIGWSSDWNGWTGHSAPVYGEKACRSLDDLPDRLPIDTRGLAHPGLIPNHFERLERMGVDLSPVDAASERFLQMWEAAQKESAR